MTTSWIELQQLETGLHRQLPTQEQLVFDAQLLISPQLQQRAAEYQTAQALLRAHHRHELRREVQAVHNKLFREPAYKRFCETIFALFR